VIRRLFADSSFYVAMLSPGDRFHGQVQQVRDDPSLRVFTTEFVLCEVGNSVSAGGRASFLRLIARLRESPFVRISAVSRRLFNAGLELYGERPDKEWSLTDCTSFVEMGRLGIREALTNDRHFTQAGFDILMK
jgi:uncharacterized protein